MTDTSLPELERDLRELEDRLASGRFYGDYDEDLRLLGVLRNAIEALTRTQASGGANDDVGPLVEFFREEGYRAYGHKGDYEMWSPEQTAVHFLREHLSCGGANAALVEAQIADYIDGLADGAQGSGSDFNQGVVRGLEIAAAQFRHGHAHKYVPALALTLARDNHPPEQSSPPANKPVDPVA